MVLGGTSLFQFPSTGIHTAMDVTHSLVVCHHRYVPTLRSGTVTCKELYILYLGTVLCCNFVPHVLRSDNRNSSSSSASPSHSLPIWDSARPERAARADARTTCLPVATLLSPPSWGCAVLRCAAPRSSSLSLDRSHAPHARNARTHTHTHTAPCPCLGHPGRGLLLNAMPCHALPCSVRHDSVASRGGPDGSCVESWTKQTAGTVRSDT